MTTHQLGLIFSLVRFGLLAVIAAAAILGWLTGLQAFVAAAVVTAGSAVAHFVITCEKCGKSVYYKEIFANSAGRLINPIVGFPERQCSRCGADLEVQGAKYGQ
ncbi:hypothetical protein [Sphingosinicella sp. YJ22]|uniref:hypothetical protein n=1 Tax=Sphingosinicella sp. YJ22 TaxID=1104780 RepID=UPI00140BBD5F|nr:hypothetical protein [Sphingosinicella sp. YJ22]